MGSMRTGLWVGAGALLLAIAPWEAWGFPGYYILLRFLICGFCTFAAYVALRERSALAFFFLAVGVLFNPFVKAHLTREIWIPLDVLVATGFLVIARFAPALEAAKVIVFPTTSENGEAQPAEASS